MIICSQVGIHPNPDCYECCIIAKRCGALKEVSIDEGWVKQRGKKYMGDLKDMVNHPLHYQSKGGLEVIDVIDAFTADLQGIEAVCTGNVLKYMCRWKKKNGIEDLKKAQWYLNRLIQEVTNETST